MANLLAFRNRINGIDQYKKIYQEEGKSTFTHNGIDYDLNKLFKIIYESLPKVEYIDVDDLKWNLENSPVNKSNRVINSNLKYPILIIDWYNKPVVLDGIHRLKKAVIEGNRTIRAIRVTKDQLNKVRLRRIVEQYAVQTSRGLHIDHSDPAFHRSGIPHAEFARRATLSAKHADQQFQDVNLPRAYVYGAFLKYRDIYDHRLTPNEFKHLLAEVHKGGHIDLSRAIATDRVNPAVLYDSQVNIGPRDSHREFHFVGHPRNHPVWVFRPDSRETFAKCPEYQECMRDYAERYAANPCGDTKGGFQKGNDCAASNAGPASDDSILDAIHELKTEKYPHTKLIPLSEVAREAGIKPGEAKSLVAKLHKAGEIQVTFGKNDEMLVDPSKMKPRAASTRRVDAKKLTDKVGEVFQSLKSDHKSGLIPIPAIREKIRESLGDESARHDVLDSIIKGMVKNGQFRIVPVNDASDLSATQLNAGIPGSQETWYYLESRYPEKFERFRQKFLRKSS